MSRLTAEQLLLSAMFPTEALRVRLINEAGMTAATADTICRFTSAILCLTLSHTLTENEAVLLGRRLKEIGRDNVNFNRGKTGDQCIIEGVREVLFPKYKVDDHDILRKAISHFVYPVDWSQEKQYGQIM